MWSYDGLATPPPHGDSAVEDGSMDVFSVLGVKRPSACITLQHAVNRDLPCGLAPARPPAHADVCDYVSVRDYCSPTETFCVISDYETIVSPLVAPLLLQATNLIVLIFLGGTDGG